MIQVPDEVHAQLHTDARNAIGRIRMHAQRDIHMAECLVHGNVALCTECISVIAIRHWAVARQYGTWIRIQNRIFCIHTLSLFLSLVLLPFFSSHKRFVLRSWSRSRVKATIGEILSRSFLRILDSPGHRATKNSCLSIRGPKNVRPAAALGFVEARNKMEFVVCTRDYVHGKIFVFLRVAWNMAYILKYFPATCVIFWDSGVLVGRQWIPFEQISLVCRAHWKKFRVNTIERKFLFRRGIPPDPSGIFLHRFTPITTIFNAR